MKKILACIVTFAFVVFSFLVLSMLLAECGGLDKAKNIATKADLHYLHSAVMLFKQDTGRYPSAEKGLRELVERPDDVNGWPSGGYFQETTLPKDGWRDDFIYCVSSDERMPFVIISLGADGKPGGTGDNADIYSTELVSPKDFNNGSSGCSETDPGGMEHPHACRP